MAKNKSLNEAGKAKKDELSPSPKNGHKIGEKS